MKQKIVLAAALLAGLITMSGIVPPAQGASLPYARTRREINAGVLIITQPDPVRAIVHKYNPLSSYIFAVMDWRSDIKPRGWEFINPLAPKEATKELLNRWPANAALDWDAGDRVQKDCAAYWEVDLSSVSSTNLARFDVLYLSGDQTITLTSEQAVKLRRFVDGGGLLWVDAGRGMKLHQVNGLFIENVDIVSGGGTPWIPPQSSHHPVVSMPYKLTSPEMGAVGMIYPATQAIKPGWSASEYNPTPLLTIAELSPSGKPYIAGTEYGSGRVIVTAGWTGGAISEAACGAAFQNQPRINYRTANMFYASPAALKLSYNIVNWASSWTGFHKNARHTSYSLESLNPALVQKWKLLCPPASKESSPVIYKSVFFYVGMYQGQATLFAVDGAPEQDLDGDGYYDDGTPNDPALGDADVIWAASLGTAEASSPVIFSMQDPANPQNTLDIVTVVDGNGGVQFFQALPVNNGVLDRNPRRLSSFSVPGGSDVLAPTYHNGWLYIAGVDSRMYAVNPFLYLKDGPDPANNYQITELPNPPSGGMKSSPVVGYVHNKEKGSEVAMVYTIAPPGDTGVGSPQTNDRLYGFPVSVAGERLQFISTTGTPPYVGTFSTYLVRSGATKIALNPFPKVWYRDSNNEEQEVPESDIQINAPTTGQMAIKLPIPPTSNLPVYATYTLDYENIATNFRSPRVLYPFPPEINTFTSIGSGAIPMVKAEKSIAFGPNGLLYVPTERSTANACGSMYAFAHDTGTMTTGSNTMTPKLKWAYHLHGGDPTGSYMPSNSIPNNWIIFRSEDANGNKSNPMFKPVAYDIRQNGTTTDKIEIQGLQIKSSPAIAGDKLFVTATASTGTPDVAKGALLCFKANPDFVIKIKDPSLLKSPDGKNLKVRLWQPDPSIPATGRTPLEEAVTLPDSMVDYGTGTIAISDFGNGILRTRGSSSMPQAITNTFTPSLPVWVIVEQAMLPANYVDLSNWNNLLWFYVPQHDGGKCTGIKSSPVVMGDQVYFTCDDGYVFAIDTATGLTGGSALGFQKEHDKYIKWKDKISNSGGREGAAMAGADRLLGVVTGEGLIGFENSTTLIADNRRIVEVDGSANLTWACDSTSLYTNPPGLRFDDAVRERMPINRPSLARNFGPSDYLVVDSGNNQVIRMDKGGTISSKISKFYIPKEEERQGMSLTFSGESNTLRGPADALLWVNQEKWKNPANNNALQLVTAIHWLIADTGNFRILDVVQRFDQNNVPLTSPGNIDKLPELNWVTKTEVSQKTFAFNSVQLMQDVNPTNNSLPADFIYAAVGNYTGASGQVGGSVLKIPYRQRTDTGDPFMWQYSDGHSADVVLTAISANGRTYPLANPRFARIVNASAGNEMLLCDDRGVFNLTLVPGNTVAPAQWGITSTPMGLTTYSDLIRSVSVWDESVWQSEYRTVNLPLKAMKVQRLPNSILITNGYSGVDNGSSRPGSGPVTGSFIDNGGHRFSGEVFEIKMDTGQNGVQRLTNEIIWYAPRMEEEVKRSMSGDVRVDVRRQKFEQSSPLEQPMSGERILW